MSRREVVITGMGLVTPLGRNVEENWAQMAALQTGIGHYPRVGAARAFEYLGKVDRFELPGHAPQTAQREMRFLNRSALLGLAAACEAMRHGGPRLSEIPESRRALFIASGNFTQLGYEFMYPAIREATDAGWEKVDFQKLNDTVLHQVNPFFLLDSLSNNLFSFLSASFEFRGPNTSLASLSPYGAQALELAFRSIAAGRADVALAVGYGNWITEIVLYELEGLRLLSRCAAGASSFRPFDRNRDGFIPGEGGAALFLEAADIAARHGTPALGRIKGTGNCIEPSPGQGIAVPPLVNKRSIRTALEDAGMGIRDMAFVSAHGSGTQKGDRTDR